MPRVRSEWICPYSARPGNFSNPSATETTGWLRGASRRSSWDVNLTNKTEFLHRLPPSPSPLPSRTDGEEEANEEVSAPSTSMQNGSRLEAAAAAAADEDRYRFCLMQFIAAMRVNV